MRWFTELDPQGLNANGCYEDKLTFTKHNQGQHAKGCYEDRPIVTRHLKMGKYLWIKKA